jgi:hypothetical protein
MTNKQGKTLGKKILGVCEVTPTKSLPHTTVRTNGIQLMEENTQLTCEVSHLHSSIYELRE